MHSDFLDYHQLSAKDEFIQKREGKEEERQRGRRYSVWINLVRCARSSRLRSGRIRTSLLYTVYVTNEFILQDNRTGKEKEKLL